MKNSVALRLPGQAVLAIAESVWKRVFDQTMGLILLAMAALAFILGLSMDAPAGEARIALLVIQIFVSLLVIFIGTTEIPRDLATRNAQFFLSKPLGRGGYLLGKFAGILILGEIILMLCILCFEAGMAAHGFWNFPELAMDSARMALNLAVISALLVGLSVALPEMAATIFGVAFYILSHLVYILPTMLRLFVPEWLLPFLLSFYYLVPNSYYYFWSGEDVQKGYFLFLLVLYSFAYCSLALMAANLWFRRRDLN